MDESGGAVVFSETRWVPASFLAMLVVPALLLLELAHRAAPAGWILFGPLAFLLLALAPWLIGILSKPRRVLTLDPYGVSFDRMCRFGAVFVPWSEVENVGSFTMVQTGSVTLFLYLRPGEFRSSLTFRGFWTRPGRVECPLVMFNPWEQDRIVKACRAFHERSVTTRTPVIS
ncbi:hypothetical protein [Thioalkalivibrio sp. ALE30]|uniref:hypothetical protein n=1 Tax=Thioalkalivibrio sp. ALE30 TaxID=1158181 RepID=UPI0009D94BDA|nr:hypothetical protein [Thioalkalivibrio sp. ALE30]